MTPAGDHRRKGRTVKTALALFACFLFVLVSLALGEREALPGVLLERLPSGGAKTLLFQEKDGFIWLASSGFNSTLLLKLDGETGKELARREVTPPLRWAALRGDSLFGREDGDGRAELLCWDAQTLEPVFQRELALDPMEIVLFECDRTGTAFSVLSKNHRALRACFPDGGEEERMFPGEIGFLAVDEEDSLVLYAGDTLYIGKYETEDLREVAGFPQPAAFLGRGIWIDTGGMVRRLEEQGVSSVFQTAEAVFDSRFYCLDREGGLLLSVGPGDVRRYGPDGSPSGSCTVGGEVVGLCPWGALCERDGSLFYTRLSFSQAFPSPSFSPSFSPSPSPDPQAPAWVEGSYLIMPDGTTAAEIRELMKPETADIRDKMGNQVLRGRLSTGMTVNDWTVVVSGDCDGSGTVTGVDVRGAMEMVLNGEESASCFFRAADLDNDGAISAADLARLSNMASGE